MATVAFMAAGSAIAAHYEAGVVATAAATAVGSYIGSWVDSKWLYDHRQDRQTASKLTDLGAMSSSYGRARPFGYGGFRVPGTVIWEQSGNDGIMAVRLSETRDRVVYEWYEYYWTAAIAFGEATDGKIIRIWADGKLIYDALHRSSVVWPGAGAGPRLYTGSATQAVDPDIQADVPANRAPAFRGTVYAVLDMLHLEKFGNRKPSIEAEIAYSYSDGTQTITTDLITAAEGSPFDTDAYDTKKIAITVGNQPSGTTGYLQVLLPSGNTAKTGLRKIDLNADMTLPTPTLTETGGYSCNDMGFGQKMHDEAPLALLNNQDILVVLGDNGSGDVCVPIVRVDHVTMQEIARVGENSAASYGFSYSGGKWYLEPPMHFALTDGTINDYWGASNYIVTGAGGTGYKGMAVGVLKADLSVLWTSVDDWYPSVFSGTKILALIRGPSTYDGTTTQTRSAYILTGPNYSLGADGGSIYLYRIDVDALTDTVSDPVLVATKTPASLVPGAVRFVSAGNGARFDPFGEMIIFSVEDETGGSGKVILKYDPVTDTVSWRATNLAELPTAYANPFLDHGYDKVYAYIVGNRIYTVSNATGEVEMDGVVYGSTAPDGAGMYHGLQWSIYAPASSGGLVRFPILRHEIPAVSLDSVLADLSSRCGLAASDYDTTGVASLGILGYEITRSTTARAVMEDLAAVYLFDAVESDGKIKYIQRTATPVLSLMESDLCEQSGDQTSGFSETRLDDLSLPREMTLNFIDANADYHTANVRAARILSPVPSMRSNEAATHDIALVMNPDFARQQAEKILNGIWTERETHRFSLPWQRIALDIGDVVTVTLDDGTIYTSRIVREALGASKQIDYDGVAQATAQYTDASTAYMGDGFPQQEAAAFPDLMVQVVDMPTPHDQFEPRDRTVFNLAVFVSRVREDDLPFIGATIWLADENGNYEIVGRVTKEFMWGRTRFTFFPPNFSEYSQTGLIGLYYQLQIGTAPESGPPVVSYKNGYSYWVYCIHPSGLCEIVGADYSYGINPVVNLSHLSRALRGTSDAMDEIAPVGSTIFLAEWSEDGTNAQFPAMIQVPLERLGQELTLKVVAFDQALDDANEIHIIPIGRSLMPYAPCAVRGHRVTDLWTWDTLGDIEEIVSGARGIGDIVLTWQRRTRCRGDWLDGTPEAPLYEDVEVYEIEIYYPEGTLVRTIDSESIEQNRYNYSISDQTTDGIPAGVGSIWVKVFQLSSQVGRGFARKVEVKLNVF